MIKRTDILTLWQRLLGWLAPCNDATLRDVMIILLGGQGIIRLVDGLLFIFPKLPYLSDPVYGHALLLSALAMLLTRSTRTSAWGGIAAACGAGTCTMLGVATWQVSSVSSFNSLIFTALLVNEALAARRIREQ